MVGKCPSLIFLVWVNALASISWGVCVCVGGGGGVRRSFTNLAIFISYNATSSETDEVEKRKLVFKHAFWTLKNLRLWLKHCDMHEQMHVCLKQKCRHFYKFALTLTQNIEMYTFCFEMENSYFLARLSEISTILQGKKSLFGASFSS